MRQKSTKITTTAKHYPKKRPRSKNGKKIKEEVKQQKNKTLINNKEERDQINKRSSISMIVFLGDVTLGLSVVSTDVPLLPAQAAAD